MPQSYLKVTVASLLSSTLSKEKKMHVVSDLVRVGLHCIILIILFSERDSSTLTKGSSSFVPPCDPSSSRVLSEHLYIEDNHARS